MTTNAKKSHTAGFDDETDPRDYGDIAEAYDGQSTAPEDPNWNDDAEGYGDPRHGRPAVPTQTQTPTQKKN
jgi:hypothetical protein